MSDPHAAVAAGQDAVPATVRVARRVLVAVAALFAAGVAAQAYLVGLAVFADALRWLDHVAVGHGLGFVALAVAACAPFARLPRPATAGALALPLLFGLQYLFAGIGGAVGALHAANVLALFTLALALVRAARRVE